MKTAKEVFMPQDDRYLQLLKEHSVFWSQLGWVYDPPRLDADGRQIAFYPDSSRQLKYHRDFRRAGIRIHSSLISSGWVDTDRFDYTETDRTLNEIFSCGDDLFYLPRIKLNVPLNWGKSNPGEMCLYYPGTLSEEEIAGIVNTDRHDIFGMDLPWGYSAGTGGWKDDRSNVGGLIGNQSFASRKWLADAGEALRRFVQHLENGPYAGRIIGYHIGYGMCGETSLWRAWENRPDYCYGDYSAAFRKSFFDWGLNRYGSPEKLADVWRQPGITRDNVILPAPEEREFQWRNTAEFFRETPNRTLCIDCERFTGDVNVNALEHFARIAKTISGKPVGAFYGYYMFVPRSAYTGHLAYERLLASPWIDFIASPKSYRRVEPGEPGSEQVASMSIGRKKLYVDELDNRTYLSGCDVKTFFQTRSVMWREFAKNMMNHSNFWWMDLHGGWFDSPEILNEIGRIEQIAEKIRRKTPEPVAEVLMVTDENGFYAIRPHRELHRSLLVDSPAEIRLCGTPVDHFRWHDLLEMEDLSRYRCIFFMNQFCISPEEWRKIRKKFRHDAHFCWHYAPGIRNPEFNLSNVADLCGMSLNEYELPGRELHGAGGNLPAAAVPSPEGPDYPHFCIGRQPGMETLAVYDDACAAASVFHDGHWNTLIAEPVLTYPYYREIMKRAGVAFYAPENTAVYADNRFFAVFSREKMEFPLPAVVHEGDFECVSGKEVQNQYSRLKMEAQDARFFLHA